MKSIYKYKLEPQDENILKLRGPVLSAGVQGDDIVFWAVHDDELTPRPVRISIRGTGHLIEGADDGQFIGTVFLGPLVFHIFAGDGLMSTPPPADPPAVRARIVEEFVEACRDTHPVYSVFDRRDAVDAANAFLDRNPHIAEGWPNNDRR